MTRGSNVRGAGLVVLLLGLAALAGWAERGRVARETRLPPRVGQVITVDGQERGVWVSGHGRPVVVLDAGHGGSLLTWSWIQPRVAEVTRVVSFDRPGMGRSASAASPRTADRIAAELHAVLEALGETGPYVLAGHSMGGFTIRAFAELYPHDVAGVVFVDSSHEDEEARLAEVGLAEGHLMDLLSAARFAQPLGVGRLLERFHLLPPLEILAPLPADVAAHVRADFHQGPALDTFYREARDYPASARWVAGTGDLGDRPTLVLTRDLGERRVGYDAIGAELGAELAALSSRGEMREVPDSTHDSIVLSERHARVVADAIIEIVRAVRPGESSATADARPGSSASLRLGSP